MQKCPYCPAKFTFKFQVNEHIQVKHPGQPLI